jgi:hypothetical protein
VNQEIINLLKAAVECSVFLSPTDPGLDYEEILEVGKRAGFQAGEVGDAAIHAGDRLPGGRKTIPDSMSRASWPFIQSEEPEYRNFDAFDFVVSELNDRVRADGVRNARLERSVIVERGLAKGLRAHDVQLAITYLVFADQITEAKGILQFSHNSGVRALPSQTRDSISRGRPMLKPARERVYPIVKDIIERRTEGRSQSVESLEAFAEQLSKLGYGIFRMWWMQTAAELRRADVYSAPVSVCVLSAALVEGVLTFVVKHARAAGLGVFRSSDFDRNPRTWKIDDLVASAASGSDTAILDIPTKTRAEILIKTRQRIHAGRMLSDYPAGVPDLRPEEARDAKATADQVVRRVLDWLERFPPA